MSRPDVLACALATEQAQIQSATIDNRLMRSELDAVQIIATSRDTIARSRETLARLANRTLL